MASQKDDVNCEFCNKTFDQSTILKHIGKKVECKKYYGPRFIEMMKERNRNRVEKHRNNMTRKEQKENLKRRRDLYSNNEKQKQKNKQTYQEKKEFIKAKNEKESKDFFKFFKEENEKEIDEDGLKEGDLNILYKSAENPEEIFGDPTMQVICEHCKGIFESDSILKHISNNKGCKSFYGSSFEVLKKKKDKLYSKQYSLAKEREKYATNPDFKEKKLESSKKSYQTLKKKENAIKEKQKIEDEKKDAKRSYEFKKKVAKDMLYLWGKKLQWFTNCFLHFLETFPDTDEKVKSKMMDIEKSIKEKQEKMKNKVDEIF